MTGPDDDPPLILGAQLAAAQAAEARHQAARSRPEPSDQEDPSPLAGISYDQPPADLGLLHFRPARPDDLIDAFVGRFTESTDAQRARLRSALTMDDFYTLLFYARRAVVRALRTGDVDVAARAVNALAAVDTDRVDARDLIWQAGLLAYAVRRVGGDVPAIFEAAAARADPQTAELLRGVGGRPPGTLKEWGYKEVETADGIGLAEDDGGRDQARSDLIDLAERIADRIAADGTWQLGEPAVGARLQPVWLRAGRYPEPDPDLDQAREAITGCVIVRGGVESAWSVTEAQHLMLFVMQTRTVEAAEVIARCAGPGTGTWFAGFGVAAGQLCAMLVARSVIAEVSSAETQQSLERFRPVLAEALLRALR